MEAAQAQLPGHKGMAVSCRGSGAVTAQRQSGALTVPHNAAEYFAQRRTFTGVETVATGAAAKTAEFAARGLSGRAAAYDSELQ